MESIQPLPAAPLSLWNDPEHGLVLVFAQGLTRVRDGALEHLLRGPLGGAARAPDGTVYLTRGGRVLRCTLDDPAQVEDATDDFGAAPRRGGGVACTPDGSVWVEGCRRRLRLNGTFADVPRSDVAAAPPLPLAVDTFGNAWSLIDEAGGTAIAVLPANDPAAWQVVPTEGGRWEALVADCAGHVWVVGPGGLHRFWPRQVEAGWRVVATGAAPVTALGLSPDDRVLAGLASGELVELDVDAAGQTVVRPLARAPRAVRRVWADPEGAIWAATDDGLYREPAAADAWQHTWQRQPGRLPGGNHDLFSVPWQGRLYMAGGLTGDWGFPGGSHVFDELFAYDPARGYWEVITRLSFPRRYSGIAELDGRIWIVGGEGELGARGGPRTTLDVVEIYDPAHGTWTAGPRLNSVRTDPFVMAWGGRIWAIGGACDPGTKLRTVESIGSGEPAWRWEAPLPEPTRQGGGCALDGILYCVSIDGAFAFDTATGAWDDRFPQPPCPIGQAPLVAAFRGQVWMMGGFRSAQTYGYDPRTRSWRAGARLPTEQSWGAAAVLDGRLILVGGAHRCELHDTIVYDDRTFVLR